MQLCRLMVKGTTVIRRVTTESLKKILGTYWTVYGPRHAGSVTFLTYVATQLSSSPLNSVPTPLHTFKARSTAIHLNYDASCRHVPIDDIAEMFELPDLRGKLANYLLHEQNFPCNLHTFGSQRRSLPDAYLPFRDLHVWYKVRLQQKVYHNPSTVAPTFIVNAHPPDSSWKYGQYDAVVMNIDDQWQWPSSGLQGVSFHSCYYWEY